VATEYAGDSPATTLSRDEWLLQRLTGADGLSRADCARVRELTRIREESLPRLLARLGLVTDDTLGRALAEFHAVPFLAPEDFPQAPLNDYAFSTGFLRESAVLPLGDTGGEMVVAMTDPGDRFAIDSIRMICGRPVRPCAAPHSRLMAAIEELYGAEPAVDPGDAAQDADTLAQWKDRIDDTPVIRLVNDLIRGAVRQRASDIHIEPGRDMFRVRYRIDGVLHHIETILPETGRKACARIKLIARLDVAERRLPQGGRFQFDVEGATVDMRISTMPVLDGEGIVLRILDRGNSRLELEDLGFSAAATRAIEECLRPERGLLLVVGPTGSGKTTTLYSALDKLNADARKLITVEDPVEYELAGVNQIQVRPELDLTFASALRSVLRQDPDIIMVGEIRDPETAAICVQAALTGHLVLSTLHTNEAAAAFARLIDLGVADYLLGSTVSGVLAQRLVRRLCPHCRVAIEPDAAAADWLAANGAPDPCGPVYQPGGCGHCDGTGYRGRTAVGEFIAVDDSFGPLIRARSDVSTLRAAARERGSITLVEDAVQRVLLGETSVTEAFRCTH
jgi:general secretion pathway protein E